MDRVVRTFFVLIIFLINANALADIPNVKVITKSEKNFTVNFEWPSVPKYTTKRSNKGYTIFFNQAGKIDFTKLNSLLPKGMQAFVPKSYPGSDLVIKFSPSKGMDLITRTENNTVIMSFSPEEEFKVQDSGLADQYDKISVQADSDKTILKLEIDKPIAVYRRGGHVYVTFPDENFSSEMPEIPSNDFILALELLKSKPLNMIRIHQRVARLPTVKKEGKFIILEFSNTSPILKKKLPAAIQFGKDAALRIKIFEEATSYQITDPEIGDRIIIVPLRTGGILQARSWVEFDLLQSSQGIVVPAKSPDVSVSVAQNEFTLKAPNNTLVAHEQKARRVLVPKYFSIEAPITSWWNQRQKLWKDIFTQPKTQRFLSILELARFYILSSYGEEALSTLEYALKLCPNQAMASPDFFVLRGMASFLDTSYGQAVDDLIQSGLSHEPEVAFWLDLSKAGNSSINDFKNLEKSEELLKNYPVSLKVRLTFFIADKFVSDPKMEKIAKTLIESINPRSLSSSQLEEYHRLIALFYQKEPDKAFTVWYLLSTDSKNPIIKAVAEFFLIKALYDKKSLTTKEAINRLEKSRFGIRGDLFESYYLSFMSTLYSKKGDLIRELKLLREAIQKSRNPDQKSFVLEQMRKTINRIMSEKEFKKLSPLALFQIQKDLEPFVSYDVLGSEFYYFLGNTWHSYGLYNLAARSFDKALLSSNNAESRIKNIKALVDSLLRDKQTLLALKALYFIKEDITNEEKDIIDHLKAKVWIQHGNPGVAYNYLSTHRTPENLALLADGLADSKNWEKAAPIYEEALSKTYTKEIALKLGMAYTINKNEKKLKKLISELNAREYTDNNLIKTLESFLSIARSENLSKEDILDEAKSIAGSFIESF